MTFPKRSVISILLVGIVVALIPLMISEQGTVIASVVTTLLLFMWFEIIFLFGIPKIRRELASVLSNRQVTIVFLGNLLLPYMLLIIMGLTSSHLIFFLWYILPSILLGFLLQTDNAKPMTRILLTTSSALLYWIGFDHRYTMILFDIFNDLSYIMNAFWMASLLMIGYGYKFGVDYHLQSVNEDRGESKVDGLQPTVRGVKVAQVAALGASVIIVPVGLITGFLEWNPLWSGIFDVIISFIGIYLTISLQEELVFRGVILNELDMYLLEKSPIDQGNHRMSVLTLVGSSLLFGMTHWNNEIPQYIPHYIALASVAGIAYGWAYRKSGMFGAMLTHTLIDWVWNLFLQRTTIF